MRTSYEQISYMPPFLMAALCFSILAHIVVFSLFYYQNPSISAFDLSQAVEVSFIPPPSENTTVKRQIVSPPEQTDSTPPKLPSFESDKDNSTPKEQIKRGDDPEAGASPLPPSRGTQAKTQNTKKQPQEKPAPPKPQAAPALKQLKLDSATLLEKFGSKSEQTTEDRLAKSLSDVNPELGNPSIQPFSRAAGSGARIFGRAGSNDYLPHLPDGDLTLLNTKANLYAVFVRRVATQVFGQLRASGWDVLRHSDISSIQNENTVYAVLSPQGQLLKVTLEDSSGNRRFDEVVQAAVQSGAKDPNPPKGAEADDGNIHFIFKANSWAMRSSDPRTGAPYERRWLLLATGLE